MTDQPVILITVDGEEFKLFFDEITGLDAKDFRAAVGIALAKVWGEQSEDIDTTAGLLWLIQRKDNPGLTYEMVARGLTYGSDVVWGGTVGPEPDADPVGHPEA